MSGSLTRGGKENVPGIPGACVTCNFAYLVRGPCLTSINENLLCIASENSLNHVYATFTDRPYHPVYHHDSDPQYHYGRDRVMARPGFLNMHCAPNRAILFVDWLIYPSEGMAHLFSHSSRCYHYIIEMWSVILRFSLLMLVWKVMACH